MMMPCVLVLVSIGSGTSALSDVIMRLWLGSGHPDAAFALRLLMATLTVTLLGEVAR